MGGCNTACVVEGCLVDCGRCGSCSWDGDCRTVGSVGIMGI